MPLGESEQREWKRRIVADALARLGGIRDVSPDEVVDSPRDLGYRNRLEFGTTRGADGGLVIGLRRAASQELVEIGGCLLAEDGIDAILASTRTFFSTEPGRSDPALDTPEDPLRLLVRRSSLDGRLLVALRGLAGPFPSAPAYARFVMDHHPEVSGVVRVLGEKGRRGNATIVPLLGDSWIEERLAGTAFRIPADTFIQVNSGALDALVGAVLELAGPVPGKRVLELYGGVGVFSFALARRGATTLVVEADADAVTCGRDAAAGAEGGPAFLRSDALRYLRSAEGARDRADVVVADPPRTGLGKGVAAALGALTAHRLVLVSCDPATLARDARDLTKSGFLLRRVLPVDLFPQTARIEAVALFTRSEEG
jgi:23S rRNA (uracil1939-C5)-methyltransferase